MKRSEIAKLLFVCCAANHGWYDILKTIPDQRGAEKMKLLDSHEDGYGQGSTTKGHQPAERDLILQLEWDNHWERKES